MKEFSAQYIYTNLHTVKLTKVLFYTLGIHIQYA